MEFRNDIVEQIDREFLKDKEGFNFKVGDKVEVDFKTSPTVFRKISGTVTAIFNKGVCSSFYLIVNSAKLAERLKRKFFIYSGNVKVTVLQKMQKRVRRAKLYYLDKMSGKKARLSNR